MQQQADPTGRRRTALAAGVLILLAGCTSSRRDDAGSTGPAPGCPSTERAAPDPGRPVIDLDFRLEDDRRTVTGTEAVAFTPDMPVEEVWFRLIPNAPQSAGHELRVDAVRGDDVAGGGYVDADAEPGTPGGLYRVDLRRAVPAGETVDVEVDFTLRLTSERTPAGFDRLGVDDDVTWWASGFPLLTWEPGAGWARDPFVEVSGETTANAVADTTISVSAPEELVVLMSGDQEEPRDEGSGRRVWESHEPVARDVHVAAGEFETAEVEVDGTAVTVGAVPGADSSAEDLADATSDAIRLVAGRFGPFPYPTLTVALVSDGRDGGGEEYSSSILLGGDDFGLVVHEVAHMWFYGMVGNSQFRDPWLDEAFATYAESVADEPHDPEDDLDRGGSVGGSMADFSDQDDYEHRVYGKGAAALWAARDAVGADDFDRAVRCYVETQAWTLSRPEDLARALADLPEALEVLVEAGALDRADLSVGG
ncbi:peptidase M1 [Blastococcus sp. TF02-09]|uniref:M1 family aminopeptidase n=1 Tax=Blastococcus sp. TF02-09 TaxID=2250576 RepID=UPI000DEB7B99|nr:M1 family aminopeptidase [Blastococcus sp. TF02-9]RBY77020.1 peptidase M1 [Blastococcus sp. TF02-9]